MHVEMNIQIHGSVEIRCHHDDQSHQDDQIDDDDDDQ